MHRVGLLGPERERTPELSRGEREIFGLARDQTNAEMRFPEPVVIRGDARELGAGRRERNEDTSIRRAFRRDGRARVNARKA